MALADNNYATPRLPQVLEGGPTTRDPALQETLDAWGRLPTDPEYGLDPSQPPHYAQSSQQPMGPSGSTSTPFEIPLAAAGQWQHPLEAYHPGSSWYAPRLVQNGDSWILNEHGNQRPLVGDEVARAQGYVTDFWNKFPTGFQPDSASLGQATTNAGYGIQAPPTGISSFFPNGDTLASLNPDYSAGDWTQYGLRRSGPLAALGDPSDFSESSYGPSR